MSQQRLEGRSCVARASTVIPEPRSRAATLSLRSASSARAAAPIEDERVHGSGCGRHAPHRMLGRRGLDADGATRSQRIPLMLR